MKYKGILILSILLLGTVFSIKPCDTIQLKSDTLKFRLVNLNNDFELQLSSRENQDKLYNIEKYVPHLVTLLIFLLGFWRISYTSKKNIKQLLLSRRLEIADDFRNAFIEYFFIIKTEFQPSTIMQIKEIGYISIEHHKLSLKLLLILKSEKEKERELMNQINSFRTILKIAEYESWLTKTFELGQQIYMERSNYK